LIGRKLVFSKTRFVAATVVVLVAVVSLGVSHVFAAPPPPPPEINGTVSGIELCPEFRCGAAIFTGRFDGSVGNVYDANGTWSIAVQHGALAREVGGVTEITGGLFSLNAAGRTFQGYVLVDAEHVAELTTTQEGTGLLARGALFDIDVTLMLTQRKKPYTELHFLGRLDHTNVPLVTVEGSLSPP